MWRAVTAWTSCTVTFLHLEPRSHLCWERPLRSSQAHGLWDSEDAPSPGAAAPSTGKGWGEKKPVTEELSDFLTLGLPHIRVLGKLQGKMLVYAANTHKGDEKAGLGVRVLPSRAPSICRGILRGLQSQWLNSSSSVIGKLLGSKCHCPSGNFGLGFSLIHIASIVPQNVLYGWFNH